MALVSPESANAGSEKTVAQAESYWVPDFERTHPTGRRGQVFGLDAGIKVPIKLRKDITPSPGAMYHLDDVAFNDSPAPNLHFIDFKLELKAKLPRGRIVKTIAKFGLMGGLNAIDAGVLRGSGFVLATHEFSKKISVGAPEVAECVESDACIVAFHVSRNASVPRPSHEASRLYLRGARYI